MTKLQETIIITMHERLGKNFQWGAIKKSHTYSEEQALDLIKLNQVEYEKLNSYTWKITDIELLLNKNVSFVIKSLLKLRDLHIDNVEDLKGFNKFDAPFLCDLASKYDENKKLTNSQFEWAKNKLFKYRVQLCKIANENVTKKCKVPSILL